jgi:hypothetical protein
MGRCALEHWGITGSRADAYSAELAAERYEGMPVVRMWRSSEGADGFGAMCQLFSAGPYVGKRVRLSAALRTVAVSGRAALCLRVDGPRTTPSGRSLAFDNMGARPVIAGTTNWSRLSCVVEVALEATAIFISNLLEGTGELFWAEVRFEVVDASTAVSDMLKTYVVLDEPKNLDFSEAR